MIDSGRVTRRVPFCPFAPAAGIAAARAKGKSEKKSRRDGAADRRSVSRIARHCSPRPIRPRVSLVPGSWVHDSDSCFVLDPAITPRPDARACRPKTASVSSPNLITSRGRIIRSRGERSRGITELIDQIFMLFVQTSKRPYNIESSEEFGMLTQSVFP